MLKNPQYRKEIGVDGNEESDQPVWRADRFAEIVGDEPKEIAFCIGVSTSTIYNYLQGRMPRADVLFRIARYADRPMEYFLQSPETSSVTELRRAS